MFKMGMVASTLLLTLWVVQLDATTKHAGRYTETLKTTYSSKSVCESKLKRMLEQIGARNKLLRSHDGPTLDIHDAKCIQKM